MTLPKGWINRQVARTVREAEKWPDWMKREVDIRLQEQSSGSQARTPADENRKPNTTKE